ncbi:hypothetical protein D9M70_549450 [compost metagenome]
MPRPGRCRPSRCSEACCLSQSFFTWRSLPVSLRSVDQWASVSVWTRPRSGTSSRCRPSSVLPGRARPPHLMFAGGGRSRSQHSALATCSSHSSFAFGKTRWRTVWRSLSPPSCTIFRYRICSVWLQRWTTAGVGRQSPGRRTCSDLQQGRFLQGQLLPLRDTQASQWGALP